MTQQNHDNPSVAEGAESVAAPAYARPAGAASKQTRGWAALVFLGCAAILGVAIALPPSPTGMGTHAQLPGIMPCGMLVVTGFPCPTCGMTTAFAHTVRLQWLQALYAQPTGFLLALVTIYFLGVSAVALVRGRWPWAGLWLRIGPYELFLALLVALLAGWGFKIVVGLANHTLPYR